MNIYEIVGDAKTLKEMINEEADPETGELREVSEEEKQTFLSWINENQENLEAKFNSIYKVICNKKAEAEIAEAEKNILSAELDRLRKRAKARFNEVDRIKGLIGWALEKLGMKKYKTGLFSIGFQATKKSAKPVPGVFNSNDIPVRYLKRELSLSAINQAIADGTLYEKEGPENRTKLFYKNSYGEERTLLGVAYSGGETLVIR